jgi:hypothetical protein
MRTFIAGLLLLASLQANAGWVAGTYKCKDTTYTVTEVKLGDLTVPYMNVTFPMGYQAGFPRIVHTHETHTEYLILASNVNALPFQNGAIAKDWCSDQ